PLLVFLFHASAPTAIYTLSLHDALPISSSENSMMSPLSASSGARARDRKYRPGLSGCRAEMCPNESSTRSRARMWLAVTNSSIRSEEHTSELQSLRHLVCRLLLEKKKKK